jgi:hypothetical protein
MRNSVTVEDTLLCAPYGLFPVTATTISSYGATTQNASSAKTSGYRR